MLRGLVASPLAIAVASWAAPNPMLTISKSGAVSEEEDEDVLSCGLIDRSVTAMMDEEIIIQKRHKDNCVGCKYR